MYLPAPGLPQWSTAADPSPSGARPRICAAYFLLLPRRPLLLVSFMKHSGQFMARSSGVM